MEDLIVYLRGRLGDRYEFHLIYDEDTFLRCVSVIKIEPRIRLFRIFFYANAYNEEVIVIKDYETKIELSRIVNEIE